MAGGADWRIRCGLSRAAKGSHQDNDPRQSEMFRAERASRRTPQQSFRARGEYRGQGQRCAIATGNARVVQARLSDAKFFFETDLKIKLEGRLAKLDQIVFHEKLGTQGERVRRLERLAREIAPHVGADGDLAARAARLAKADLTSEMVGEFPELQA